tara:strand:- start:7765 stop:7950 length:186 start_codon:yes stop_codon:yes gene_type:complete
MNKQDLTRYSDDELSLVVFNTERLYVMRTSVDLLDEIAMFFYYTPKQLEVLIHDLEEEFTV